MSYIGAQVENRISPAFIKEDFVGTGSATNFTLTNEVPGGAAQNVMVLVNNCLLYTSPSPRDGLLSRMPSSA